MSEYFATLLFWHWWILALALIIIEMMAPGFFLMWIGGAAAVTGLVTMIAPSLPWQAQFVLFGVLAIASVVGARYYFKRNPIETTDSTLNNRGAQ
jgi:membrane protein implicated in regulation of membrane protease activity